MAWCPVLRWTRYSGPTDPYVACREFRMDIRISQMVKSRDGCKRDSSIRITDSVTSVPTYNHTHGVLFQLMKRPTRLKMDVVQIR